MRRTNRPSKALTAIAEWCKIKRITVGVHSDAAAAASETSPSTTVGEIAHIHEYGAPNAGIPQRSFLRSWFDAAKKRNTEIVRRMVASTVTGKRTVARAVETMGRQFVGDCQLRITQKRIKPPLRLATIERKGSSTPLIDRNQLKASITFEVVR